MGDGTQQKTPGDPRDTITPAAMLGLTRRLLLGPVLTPAPRARLIACYLDGSPCPTADFAAHAEVARVVAEAFA